MTRLNTTQANHAGRSRTRSTGLKTARRRFDRFLPVTLGCKKMIHRSLAITRWTKIISMDVMSEVPNATPAREVRAGGTIRFAVGSPTGLRSSTWRIWSAKHTKNVYLAARSIAGLQKVSLHESRSWSHSFVSDERAKPFVTPGSSRHVDIWPAPPSFGEGWRRGYCIIVPSTDLRPWPQAEPGDIAFAPLPGTGHWVYIEVVFVAAGTTTRLVFDEMHLIGSMSLVDGSEVKVVARRVRPTRDEAGKLALAREQALAQVASMPNPRLLLRPDANLRLGVFGSQSDGTRFWADLAVVPPPPGAATICTGHSVKVPINTSSVPGGRLRSGGSVFSPEPSSS
jgi:hypothetical protein